jgi:hypothetical protein
MIMCEFCQAYSNRLFWQQGTFITFYFQKIQRITFKAIFVANGQLSEFVTPG